MKRRRKGRKLGGNRNIGKGCRGADVGEEDRSTWAKVAERQRKGGRWEDIDMGKDCRWAEVVEEDRKEYIDMGKGCRGSEVEEEVRGQRHGHWERVGEERESQEGN